MSSNTRTCFDRILPRDINRPQRTMNLGNGRAGAIIDFRKLWINGSTLRVRFLEGSAQQQAAAKEQAKWWSDHANLNFDFTDDADAEIRISFDEDDGAWSYIGTDALDIPRNEATMNLGFLDGGTAAHEFGHAIGLHHEHQNPDGGIVWNERVVIDALSRPPNRWTEQETRHNVLNKYSADQVRGTEFDPDSIMLYFFPDSWVLNGNGTKDNEVLSAQDKAFIASEQAYPGKRQIDITELPVTNMQGVRADIGAPGEEDLFKFVVTEPGQHTVTTNGQTDLVMKLFGPDSATALIAEDGGEGYNPKIAANLSPGEYIVQVRHYNRQSGTGSYSILVSN